MRIAYIYFLLLLNIVSIGIADAQVESIQKLNEEKFVSPYQEKVFSNLSKGGELNSFSAFLTLDPAMSESKFIELEEKLNAFCSFLNRKRGSTEKDKFLRYIFYKVHRTFLKHYQLNSPLYKTLATGQYDCVSGTSLYALVLDKLGIKYAIKETRFHVYLVTFYNNKKQLWESTDPLEGWINEPEEVKSREELYQVHSGQNENYYFYKGPIDGEINIIQLAGLQYYNEGTFAYNNKNFISSLNNFEKALKLYNSQRIQEIFKRSLEVFANEISYKPDLNSTYNYYTDLIGR